MTPYYEEAGIVIYNADCREVLPTLGPVDLVLLYGYPYTSRASQFGTCFGLGHLLKSNPGII